MITEEAFANKFAILARKHFEKSKMTQEALAHKAELSVITVNRLLNKHKKRMSAYLMMKIVKALDIDLRDVGRIL
jgi:transcriptional regulator with XRE-family HTH domain